VADTRPSLVEAAGELARYVGAVSLLMVAAIHAQQYYDAFFKEVPTIGRLFMLNIVGAGVAGLVLLAPVRLLGSRLGNLIYLGAALLGIAVSAGAFAALVYSEYYPLFGFMESGYRLAIELALLFEGVSTVLLAGFAASILLGGRKSRRGGAADVRTRPPRLEHAA
jgi:hypothetical protein